MSKIWGCQVKESFEYITIPAVKTVFRINHQSIHLQSRSWKADYSIGYYKTSSLGMADILTLIKV